MTDLFDKKQTTDRVIVDGELLATRSSMQTRIEQRAKEKDISFDDAWASIAQEIVDYHQDRKGGGSKRPDDAGIRKQTPQVATSPISSNKENEYHIVLNGNTIQDLTDDMLPKELKDQGIGIMDALASGKLKIEGEHQLAEHLLHSAPRALGPSVDEDDPLRMKALEAVKVITASRPSIQYPLLPQSVRVMPSDFNRTSLFHVGSNNLPRRFCRNEKLGRIGNGITMFYYGEELRQTDEAIFRQLIHVARGRRPWEFIELSQCPFIRDAKGATRRLGARDLKEVNDIIMRLRSGLLFIQNKRRGFITCNLIREYEGEGANRRLLLDPRIVLLFDSYAAIEEQLLNKLSSVAGKIYSYAATVPQTGLYPILVTSLFELCYGRTEYLEKEYLRRNPSRKAGDAELSVQKKFSDFKRKILPPALDELKDHGRIATWEFKEKNTKVVIIKTPETNAIVTEALDDEHNA